VKQIRKRLTYANVMSSIAVFFVLGGATAFAASQLEKESVGTPQLQKEAVNLAKIKKKTKEWLKGATGPKGATGATGAPGAPGPAGPKSPTNVIMRTGALVSVNANSFESGTASCQPGEKAVGGGALTENVFFPSIVSSFPIISAGAPETAPSGVTPTAWKVWVSNKDTKTLSAPATTKFTPYVVCVS
jgi:hypothetical protein